MIHIESDLADEVTMMASVTKLESGKAYCFSDQFPPVGALANPNIAVVESEIPNIEKTHNGLAMVAKGLENAENIFDLYRDSGIRVCSVGSDENHEGLIQLLDDARQGKRLSSMTVYCGADWCFFGLDKGVNNLKEMQHHIVFWKKIQRRLEENAEIFIYGFKYANTRQAQLLVNILGATLGTSVYVSRRVNSRSGEWTLRSEILR